MLQKTYNTDKINRFWILVIFMLNPLISLVVAIRNCFSTYFKDIVWLFCGFYGFTFYPVNTGMDSYRHMEDFLKLAYQPNMAFQEFIMLLYSTDTDNADILLPVIEYVLSRFTDSTSIFYGVLGLLFGYFFSRNIASLLSFKKMKLNKYSILIIFTFALIIAPWEINSFRFWMGAHVLVFSLIRILLYKKNIYILGVLCTPLIHFGFLLIIIIFFTYKIFGNRISIYYILLFASLFFNGITSLSAVKNSIPLTGIEVLDKRASSYTSESYIEERKGGTLNTNWYVSARITLLYYIM